MNQKQIEHLQKTISWLKARLEKCRPQDDVVRPGLKALLASDKAELKRILLGGTVHSSPLNPCGCSSSTGYDTYEIDGETITACHGCGERIEL